jgi:hypothetical protein
VHSDLRVAKLAAKLDPATRGSGCAGPVLDPSSADAAQVIVVDVRTVGYQQFDHRMVEVEVDIDLSRLDLRQEQIEHDAATRGGNVELALGGPLAELLDGAVVCADPHGFVGAHPGRLCCVARVGTHLRVSPWL